MAPAPAFMPVIATAEPAPELVPVLAASFGPAVTTACAPLVIMLTDGRWVEVPPSFDGDHAGLRRHRYEEGHEQLDHNGAGWIRP